MKLKFLSLILLLTSINLYASTKANHSGWNEFLGRHVINGQVNYKGIKKDMNSLSDYLRELRTNSPTIDWTDNERKAYYINLYNAYTIKFIVNKYPVNSVKDISYSGKDLWSLPLVYVGENKFSLDQLQSDVLRPMNDPRILFAICKGYQSYPPLQSYAFTAENVDAKLTEVTQSFLANETYNEIKEKKVALSPLFEDHLGEFIDSQKKLTFIDFINKYSEITVRSDAKIEYKEANWTLNQTY